MSDLEMMAFTEEVSKVDLIEMLHALLLTGARYIHLAGRKWEWIELKEEYEKMKKEVM